ncbi:hypothetical protein OG905_25490 [Streptomyces sp. NBC_00322]|uniref:hypothetical protein n=1 Tax=Streptomyces sp. NBC_00322 TaxID=2975712 RepID=UPI002E2CB8FC|nr:hypothetical protein [Streptomyces sp. NBC_00322]
MNPVIDVLAASEVDRLEDLWGQLLAHHSQKAPHLGELDAVGSSEEPRRLRRGQYVEWLREPLTTVLRVLDAPGAAWQWSDQIGVLETLEADDDARGAEVGQALVGAARGQRDTERPG